MAFTQPDWTIANCDQSGVVVNTLLQVEADQSHQTLHMRRTLQCRLRCTNDNCSSENYELSWAQRAIKNRHWDVNLMRPRPNVANFTSLSWLLAMRGTRCEYWYITSLSGLLVIRGSLCEHWYFISLSRLIAVRGTRCECWKYDDDVQWYNVHLKAD